MRNYRYYPTITGIFSASIVISNILDAKFFHIGDTAFPGGIIIFPIVYVFGDIFTEVYGYAYSRRAIWTGFFSLLLLIITLQIVQKMPTASFWHNQAAFDLILGRVTRIVIASFAAYFAGEFVNSLTIAKLKIVQKGSKMSIRFVASTVFGQAVDTFVFITIAFAGMMVISEMIEVFISVWMFKVSWEIIALPFSIRFVKWLKRAENSDHYDVTTNFNPFNIW